MAFKQQLEDEKNNEKPKIITYARIAKGIDAIITECSQQLHEIARKFDDIPRKVEDQKDQKKL